jgi:sec-independent protein translocase protein TatA
MIAEIFGMDGVVVAVIAVAVLFGARRLPEMARSVGRAQGEFRKGMREGNTEGAPPSAGPGADEPGTT